MCGGGGVVRLVRARWLRRGKANIFSAVPIHKSFLKAVCARHSLSLIAFRLLSTEERKLGENIKQEKLELHFTTLIFFFLLSVIQPAAGGGGRRAKK
jgi:hypothetical protein